MKTRTEVYKWVSEYEDVFYSPRKATEPISVYFSDITRNYFSQDFIDSYHGMVNLLMHSHLPIQIVTSRTINELSPKILILPDVKCITNQEAESIQKLAELGTKFIVTGEFAGYNEDRVGVRDHFQWLNQYFNDSNYKRLTNCPGKKYSGFMKEELNNYFGEKADTYKMSIERTEFLKNLTSFTSFIPEIKIEAPIDLIATTKVDEQYVYLFLYNIRGLTTVYDLDNRNIKDVKISFNNSVGTDEVYILPFLGVKEKLKTQTIANEISFTVPEIDKGTVVVIKRN